MQGARYRPARRHEVRLVTPGEMAARLAQDAEGVCRMLLPGGKRVGAEWEAGSVGGESGRSLRVHLSRAKAGVWCDFADGAQRGELVDLWAAARGVSIGEPGRAPPEALRRVRCGPG